MNFSPRTQQTALGALLLAFGFVCGLLLGGHRDRPHQPPPHHPRHAPRAMDCQAGPLMGMSIDADGAATTVIVMRDGQPASIEQFGPTAIDPQAIPAQDHDSATPWLALLGLSALGPIIWGALVWNRRRTQQHDPGAETDPFFPQDFVPRRDD